MLTIVFIVSFIIAFYFQYNATYITGHFINVYE